MAYYTYKQVRDLLPQHIIDKQGPDYEGNAGYDGDQWSAAADYINELKAALAAKDSEIERLRTYIGKLMSVQHGLVSTLQTIALPMECGCVPCTGSCRSQEALQIHVDFLCDAASNAITALGKSHHPHPDAARLDKLPQCFHMLRFVRGSGVLPERQGWHLTYETNKVYGSVREAIDAHQPIPGIDRGQFLAACEAGNRVFGEGGTFGGTPE